MVREVPFAGSSGDAKGNKEDKKIFVGGIPVGLQESDITTYFSLFGDIVSTSVKIDRVTGRSRGFGFVEFVHVASSRAALRNVKHTIKGKTVEVKPAKTRRNKKVFVGGLDPNFPEEELRTYFSTFGVVEDVEWPFDKSNEMRRSYAFIVFTTDDAASDAVAEGHHLFGERNCDIKRAFPQNKRVIGRGMFDILGTGDARRMFNTPSPRPVWSPGQWYSASTLNHRNNPQQNAEPAWRGNPSPQNSFYSNAAPSLAYLGGGFEYDFAPVGRPYGLNRYHQRF